MASSDYHNPLECFMWSHFRDAVNSDGHDKVLETSRCISIILITDF